MNGLFHSLLWGVPAGVLGTLVMDLSASALLLAGLVKPMPIEWFSRWLGHMLRGTFSHADIARAADVPIPLPFVIATHYAIGATLGAIFFALAHAMGPRPMHISVPILYGIATTALAAFWMFPSMGLGIGGLDAPRELMLLPGSLFRHAMFGLGLGLAWTWFGR